MRDKMTRLEKLALTSAASGAVFNVFLFGVGATLATAHDGPLLYVRGMAAVLQAAAFDLVAIATVIGMRAGRRSRWSLVTAGASAGVSALIALDVAGVAPMPWLHAANALIVLAFTLHLLTPHRTSRAAQLRRLVRRLVATTREARANLATAHEQATRAVHELADARGQAARLASELADARGHLVATREQATRHAADLADVRVASARLSDELAANREQSAKQARDFAAAQRECDHLRALIREHERELAAARAQSTPVVPSRAAVLSYTRECIAAGQALEAIARGLEIPASTLRGWLQTATNGHTVTEEA